MTSPGIFRKLLIPSLLGGLMGIGFGCVITTGELCDMCGDPGCHSETVTNADGSQDCVCDPGYEFANPNDPNDFDCDPIDDNKPGDSNCVEEHNIQIGDQCACESGFAFCTTALDDYTCCAVDTETGGNDSNPGTGTNPTTTDATDSADSTGGNPDTCEMTPAMGSGDLPPDEACTPDVVGNALFCSNTAEDGPAGGVYYECTDSGWMEMPNVALESCMFDGFEFAIGCIDDGESIQFACGDGPGTDCNGEACDACADATVLNYCLDGKLHASACDVFCQETGIDGVTFETGFCDVDPADGLPTCQCCDSGDDGCPI